MDFNTGIFQNYRSFSGSDYSSYLGVSGVDGVVPTISVLTGRYWDQNNGAYELLVDLYGETQIPGEDYFTVHYSGYNYLPCLLYTSDAADD